MNSRHLQKIEKYASTEMQRSQDLFHNWKHILRVRDNALEIINKLGIKDVDLNLIQACCLLHDLCFCDKLTGSIFTYIFEPRLTLKILKKAFKNQLKFIDPKDKKIIKNAIKHHSFSFPFRKLNKKRDLYCQILEDADTLDYFDQERFENIPNNKSVKKFYNRFKFIYNFGKKFTGIFLNFPELVD